MIDFLVANLPIIISLVAGIALLVLEAFMPGFGVAGFCGIALEIVAVVLTYLWHGVGPAFLTLVIGLGVVAVAVSMSLRSIANGKLKDSAMVLTDTERSDDGYLANEDMGVFLGREGRSTTVLRPTGMAEFDGVKLNVMSDGAFIPAETKVKIVRVDGGKIVVNQVD